MRQPYPGYQSSHVEWLGDLPEHWEVRRLGAALAETVGGGTPDTGNESYWADDDEEGLRWVAIADMSAGGEVTTTAKRVTSLGRAAARLRPLPAGTIIYSMYASVGAVARLSMSAATNQAILGLVPGEMLESSFLYWWLTGVRKPVLSLTRDNTQSNLNAETVRKIPLALPPLDEQRSISAFLDHETAKIDTLVAKKRLLLERLAEYRTALITRTVTKGLPPQAAKEAGLNPNPPLKPSGVEWIGEVPEHWEVKRLEHVASYRTSSVDKKIEDEELAVRLCNYTDVYYLDRIRASDGNFMQATASPNEISRFKLNVGDILITKDSEDWTDIAVPAIVEETADDFVCGYHLGIIRPSAQTDPAFIYRSMQSEAVNRQLQVAASGVTRYGLPNSAVGEVLIPLPPLNEQRAIAAFLDSQMERIDALSSQVETAIERLQEYRSALITAAVTGKIDVREHERVEIGVSGT